jgi:multiple sugar transport system ATP-binding protein
MFYVTHDQVEAMAMADQIVVFNKGQIEQIGAPLELYHNPKSLFVAKFMGSPQMNIMPVDLTANGSHKARAELPGGSSIDLYRCEVNQGPALLGVRPEHMSVQKTGEIAGHVVQSEKFSPETMLHVSTGGHTVVVREDGLKNLYNGEACALKLRSSACHLFNLDGKLIRSGSLL